METSQKLRWVQFSLWFYLWLDVLLMLVFLAGGLLFGLAVSTSETSMNNVWFVRIMAFIFGGGGALVGATGVVLHWFAIRSLRRHQRWGWTMAVGLNVLNLLLCISTLLLAAPAVLGLLGLLDRDVQNATRE